MAARALPTFDLVLATVGRSTELDDLLTSLERQTYQGFRVLVADQNADDRVLAVLARHPAVPAVHLRVEGGLSRARNATLAQLVADVVAFPDDDGFYPDDLLETVARRLADDPALDGVTGQVADPYGARSGRWPHVRATLTPTNLWNSAASHSIFLRRRLLDRCGGFDEELGLGAGTPWQSGEEIELLVRCLRAGARIVYDPGIVVLHPSRQLTRGDQRRVAARDGASVGYILGRHRYPSRPVRRMLFRPAAGAALALLRLDADRAGVQLTTLRGRVRGLRAGRRASPAS